MQFFKAILGALIGAGIGTVIMVAIEKAGHEFAWFVIVIGLITGIVTRMLSSGGGSIKYFRGAVAALATLAAFILAKYVVAAVVTGETASMKTPVVTQPAADPDADQPAAEPRAVAEMTDEPLVSTTTDVSSSQFRKPQEFQALDMIVLAIGALVAYEIARGGGKPAAESTQPAPEEPAPEPSSEE